MMRTTTIQSTIRSQLMQQGPCTLETLLDRLPQFSWNEIFTVVDQLSREGELVLRRPTRFDYEVSIDLTRPNSVLKFSELAVSGDHTSERDEVGVTR
ncbi:MAG TPA: hypothetical protein VN666_12830 [Nitrospira sp.]|nr:hypothetical protein [Nitrospira sp.]